MDSLLERFHDEADKRKSSRYSEQLRSIAVQYARHQMSTGKKLTGIAKELGISFVTLKDWMSKTEASFLPVQVCSDPKIGGNHSHNAQGPITLVSPSGYRLDGLDIESAYQLLSLLR